MRLPDDNADELEWILFEQAGVLTSAQASNALGRAAVRHRLNTGRWRSACRGVIITNAHSESFEQHCWIASLAAGPGSLIAGLAAARLGGLRGRWSSSRIDVLVPAQRHRANLLKRLPIDLPPVKVRRTTSLSEVDTWPSRPGRIAMPRAVVEAAAWSRHSDEAQQIIAAAFQQRLVTPNELLTVLDRLPRVRRRSLIMTTAKDAAGGANALSEIDFVRLCRQHRLPRPDLQQRRTDASGRTRYRDAYWRKYRLHVEIDGGHHMDVKHWQADMIRQNDIWSEGDRILRFTAFQVRNQQGYVVRTLRRALSMKADLVID